MLIDFWTYTCINCIRTLPYLKAWDEEYRDDGLTIVGVHAPEFPFEKDAGNVAEAIERNGLAYPVVQDNDFGTWNAFGNQYWPAKYLIDAEGKIRYVHFGEGDYETTEQAIRSLLAENGDADLGGGVGPRMPRSPTPAWARPRPISAPSAPRAGSSRRRRASASTGRRRRGRCRRTASPTAARWSIDAE